MNKKTLTALRKSIAHWEENLAANDPFDVYTTSDYCALCDAFHGCIGCPVAERAGDTECDNTPWVNAHDAKHAWKYGYGTKRQFRNACRAEIKFLKSLLPEDKGNA